MNHIRLGHDIRQFTVGEMFARKAQANGDRQFLHFIPDGRRFSYRDMDELGRRAANGLAQAGVRQGSHVAMLMENSPEQIFVYLGLALLGAVAVPINASAKGELLRYFVEQSDSTVLVVDEALRDRVDAVRANLPALTAVVVNGGDPGGDFALSELLAAPDTPRTEAVRFSDLAAILYTSGTTGPSKGVMFTHVRLLTGACGHIETIGYQSDDVFHTCLPLFHANALISMFVALMADASVALSKRFSTSRFWDEVRETGATRTNILGSLMNFLWSQPEKPDDAANTLRSVATAPLPPFSDAFAKRFGVSLGGGYGISDYGVPTYTPADAPGGKFGSCGTARPGWSVRIADEDEIDLPPGQSGEILLRTDNAWEASSGYYKMPEATNAAWRNFWFHTGDLGYLDEDGYLWFTGRKKDAMRRRGENISAFEIERILQAHPAVVDAAAFPVRSPELEDEVAAALVLREGAKVTEEDIIAFCQDNMSYFMVPRFIQFLPDLPRTLTQKVEKFRLSAAAEADPGALWDRERMGVTVGR